MTKVTNFSRNDVTSMVVYVLRNIATFQQTTETNPTVILPGSPVMPFPPSHTPPPSILGGAVACRITVTIGFNHSFGLQ